MEPHLWFLSIEHICVVTYYVSHVLIIIDLTKY